MSNWRGDLYCLLFIGMILLVVAVSASISFLVIGNFQPGLSWGIGIGIITTCLFFAYLYWVRPKLGMQPKKKVSGVVFCPRCMIPVNETTGICPQCEKKI